MSLLNDQIMLRLQGGPSELEWIRIDNPDPFCRLASETENLSGEPL